MRVLDGEEKSRAEEFFVEALKECDNSFCLSSQSGCVIVKNGLVIGRGTNSPPGNVKIARCEKDDLPANFRSDKSCCIHAEQRAILDAFSLGKNFLKGSTLYYIRKKLGKKVFAGKPYCTICSKLALDAGIKEFVLWHENGIAAYDAREYNALSFAFRE
jgi:deoxycytidylate deaminase